MHIQIRDRLGNCPAQALIRRDHALGHQRIEPSIDRRLAWRLQGHAFQRVDLRPADRIGHIEIHA